MESGKRKMSVNMKFDLSHKQHRKKKSLSHLSNAVRFVMHQLHTVVKNRL